MPIYPRGTWRPLPENETEPVITPRQVILHTAVTTASSLFNFYDSPGQRLESQFYVSQDHIEQYVDTNRQADANNQANAWAISIESWDNRDPEHTPWTPRQMDMLVDLVAWCCKTHGIPARQCPAWDQSGIGWHVMWGAPSQWTPVVKTCPGSPRIRQMPELIARVQQELSPTPLPPPVPKEDDMALILRSPNSNGIFLMDDETFEHMRSHETVTALHGVGVKDTTISDVDFNTLRDAKNAQVRLLESIVTKLDAILTKLETSV